VVYQEHCPCRRANILTLDILTGYGIYLPNFERLIKLLMQEVIEVLNGF
jgi:hypothetical protein